MSEHFIAARDDFHISQFAMVSQGVAQRAHVV